MTDVFGIKMRSSIMSKVRSNGNKSTELRLIRLFNENGIKGWRRNYIVNGRPDFVFLKKRIAIFVDGCFWHGHDCRNTIPSENADYWNKKRERNMLRDREVTALFESRDWRVLRIWECDLRKSRLPETLNRIQDVLKSTT